MDSKVGVKLNRIVVLCELTPATAEVALICAEALGLSRMTFYRYTKVQK